MTSQWHCEIHQRQLHVNKKNFHFALNIIIINFAFGFRKFVAITSEILLQIHKRYWYIPNISTGRENYCSFICEFNWLSSSQWIFSFDEPSSLRIIETRAFVNTLIEEITIPSSVTRIEHNAFGGCKTLKRLLFRDNSQINAFEKKLFENMTTLEETSIPLSVRSIGCGSFKRWETVWFLAENIQYIQCAHC